MKILYFGPIAKIGRPAVGGFEAANRKNIDVLRSLGVTVIEYANPDIKRQFGAIAKLAYVKLLFMPLCLIKYAGEKDVIVHTTPLYNHLLWPSVFVVWMAKMLRIPVLMDIRAGSLINLSRIKSTFWNKGVRYMFDNSKKITVEGKSYIEDIPKVFGTKVQINYFPNITYCRDINYNYRDDGCVNLIYFGRITKSKGVDILIRMMPLLDDNYRLFLAGKISEDIRGEDLQIKNVFYLGALSPVELTKTLQKMHIFLFPSKWAGEGQSNSLIESMQNGLVPISSNQGFSCDVIGECGIVLAPDSTEENYRDAVLKVVNDNMEAQGRKSIQHITEYHNIDLWIPWLIKLYKEILE